MQNGISLLFLFMLLLATSLDAQQAKIMEEQRSLKTYPFSDPDPVPILTDNPKIYPYFKYEGYSHDSQDQDWKVVKLENDLVEIYVLPEVGGKVWGAIEKATGHEFIYRNEVMKFRNISMRGPWTSGGIEFNFGIIGHHPSTATPVDYFLQENEDGSVTCTVGNIDLPSRTQWRVKINLPKDKAAFETEAVWYNPTPMNQAYYNWMTGAAPARSDFEFYTPGDEYLKHSGEALPWPIDDMGRNIALYEDNNFGPSKSYHVVGEYNDFFGGYYHDAQYGFGHWGSYDAIPGQKLWLWALSRSGGIWEDLLTDTDGQYIEFQAGRQFLQYSPGGHTNPQTQANFEPYSTDQWREVWFPVNKIGGLSDVSEKAVMHVASKDQQVEIGINAFQKTQGELIIRDQESILHRRSLQLDPMQVFQESFDLQGHTSFEVEVKALDLHYTSDPEDLLIDRPFQAGQWPAGSSNEKLYKSGWEDMKFRLYQKAEEQFEQVLKTDPFHIDAMLRLAELRYRQGLYDEGLKHARRALQLDTYHPEANYQAGILYRAKKDYLNAKEALGWAARSMEFRSAANAQLAEILIAEEDFARALTYAEQSLDFNRYSINAWQAKAIASSKLGRMQDAKSALQEILQIDPINHFARFESYLLSKDQESREQFKASHQSELAYQTFLELAIDYYNKGLETEAIQVLEAAPQHAMVDLWWSYIKQAPNAKYFKGITELSPAFVFPFRRETLEALEWAQEHMNHWKIRYYYALNLWGKDRPAEAAMILKAIGNESDYAAFYMARANLLEQHDGTDGLADLQRAKQLDNKDWRTWRALTAYYLSKDNPKAANANAAMAAQAFPDNYAVGMDYAKTLNKLGRYEQSSKILEDLKVLPFEGASEGRRLYEKATYGAAIKEIQQKDYGSAIKRLEKSKKWSENLGVGKPFDPDERVADFLLALCYQKQGSQEKANKHWKLVVDFTQRNSHRANAAHALGLAAMQRMQGEAAARQLLQSLLQSSHGQSDVTRWVAANYLGDKKKSQDLSKQLSNSDLEKVSLIMQILNH